MDFFTNAKLLLFYDGLSKEEYFSIEPNIKARNHKSLFIYNLIITVLTGFLFVGSFFIKGIANNRISYAIIFAVTLAIVLILKYVAPKKKWTGDFASYAFTTLMLLWTTYIGTVTSNTHPATSFCVCLALLPFIVYNQVLYGAIHRMVMIIVFGIFAVIFKDRAVVTIDIVNIVSFGMIGTVASMFAQRTQANALLLRRNVASEIKRMSGIFDIIRIVDIEANTSLDYRVDDDGEKHLIGRNMDAQRQFDELIDSLVCVKNYKRMQQFCDLSTMEDRLFGNSILIRDFATAEGEWYRASLVTIETDENGYATKASFTLQIIADSFYLKMIDFDVDKLN